MGWLRMVKLSFLALVFVVPAWAAGGPSPSAAVDLPVGSAITSTGTGYDMWKLSIGTGDQVLIDIGNHASRSLYACVLDGGVTDYTYAQRPCYVTSEEGWFQASAGQKIEWALDFRRPSGNYILVFYSCCGTFDRGPSHRISDPPSTSIFDYDMRVRVRAATLATLRSGSAVVRARSPVKLSGRLTSRQPLSGAKIAIQRFAGGKWKTIAVRPVGQSGGFSVSTRASGSPGRHRFRAVFFGDDAHRETARTVTIRVV